MTKFVSFIKDDDIIRDLQIWNQFSLTEMFDYDTDIKIIKNNPKLFGINKILKDLWDE